jgi:hypothetical protein
MLHEEDMAPTYNTLLSAVTGIVAFSPGVVRKPDNSLLLLPPPLPVDDAYLSASVDLGRLRCAGDVAVAVVHAATLLHMQTAELGLVAMRAAVIGGNWWHAPLVYRHVVAGGVKLTKKMKSTLKEARRVASRARCCRTVAALHRVVVSCVV